MLKQIELNILKSNCFAFSFLLLFGILINPNILLSNYNQQVDSLNIKSKLNEIINLDSLDDVNNLDSLDDIESIDDFKNINNDSLNNINLTNDTISSVTPFKHHGKFILSYFDGDSNNVYNNSQYLLINKQDLLKYNYSNIPDLINLTLPTYSKHLGFFGDYNGYSYLGSTKSNSITFNTIDKFIPSFNLANMEIYSPEMIENIEFFTGSMAAILSNKGDNLINIQEANFNTQKPFTRFWFQDAISDFISIDGLISQNLSTNSNFYFGFKTMSSNGNFQNQWVDSWNIRSGYRMNFDTLSSLSITYLFTNHGIGTNGGSNVNTSLNPYSSLSSSPNYNTLNERNFINDLNVTYTDKLFDEFNITSNFFITNQTLERNLETIISDSSKYDKYLNSNNIGFNNKLEFDLYKSIKFRNGLNLSYITANENYLTKEINELRFSLFSNVNIQIKDNFFINGGIRLFKEFETLFSNIGISSDYYFDKLNSLKLDISSTNNSNNNLSILVDKTENQNLIFVEFLTINKNHSEYLKINIFNRIINNRPIFDINSSEDFFLSRYINQNIIGGFIDIKYNFGKDLFFENDTLDLLLTTNFNYELNKTKYNELPLLWFKISPYYTKRILSSVLKIGLDLRIFTSKTGFGFNPLIKNIMENNFQEGLTNNGLDIFVNAKLGNATVKLTFQNLLDVGFYQIPLYPNFGRNLRLSVFWSFFD